ncbi:hypothetical protein MTR_1g051700 [Medicago truncatula]|uniref:Uncharacterized protein n=1 Tax=Medicago truncatula TaxID=3880 RepID=A0A072VI78_MEDTR|nr:hypothetical protein MTR_1g051700 [Medicago truncatula]
MVRNVVVCSCKRQTHSSPHILAQLDPKFIYATRKNPQWLHEHRKLTILTKIQSLEERANTYASYTLEEDGSWESSFPS